MFGALWAGLAGPIKGRTSVLKAVRMIATGAILAPLAGLALKLKTCASGHCPHRMVASAGPFGSTTLISRSAISGSEVPVRRRPEIEASRELTLGFRRNVPRWKIEESFTRQGLKVMTLARSSTTTTWVRGPLAELVQELSGARAKHWQHRDAEMLPKLVDDPHIRAPTASMVQLFDQAV